MTFLASWRLVLLVAPLALLVAYVVAQRARQRLAVRFTSVEMLASVAPRRPGWQRHIAAGVLLVALALLVLAFAQPARAVRVPRERATVVLALDTSGSMVAQDVAPSRLAAAQEAARSFAQALPAGVQLGLVTFASSARVLVSPTSDRATVLAAIDDLQAGGGTATGEGIFLALDAVAAARTSDGTVPPAAIVLMSDGTPTIGREGQAPAQTVADATEAARSAGVKIDTIAFGTDKGVVMAQGRTIPVPSDPESMARIAQQSGGETFTAQTRDQLEAVYDQIGRVVGYEVHQQEVTAWFSGLGLALATLAAVAALIWTQRIV